MPNARPASVKIFFASGLPSSAALASRCAVHGPPLRAGAVPFAAR